MTTDSADLSAHLQSVLDAWAAAIVANDPARIASFADPGWVLVTPEAGAVTLAAFCQAVASGDLSHDAMEFTLLDAQQHGDVVVVRAHGTNSGIFRGAPFHADEWVTEVFIRANGTWRCTASALTPRSSDPSAPRPSVTPYLCVHDCWRAIEWYTQNFGARLLQRPIVMPDGRVGHAEVALGGAGIIMLSDAFPELGVEPPSPNHGAPVTLHLSIEDVDTVTASASSAGAVIERGPEPSSHGRVAVLRDPQGHRWMLNEPAGELP